MANIVLSDKIPGISAAGEAGESGVAGNFFKRLLVHTVGSRIVCDEKLTCNTS